MSKVEKALELIQSYGGIDGSHHKQWVLDQVVKILTDCPAHEKTATDCNGREYTYTALGKSEAYKKWIRQFCGEWDPDSEEYEYEWDLGTPP